MSDIVLRTTTKDGLIRAAAAVTTELVKEAQTRHQLAPTATAALGRALTANIFLSLNLKGEDTVTVRYMGNGPLGAMITQADAEHNVRGYVQEPECHLPSTPQGKLDVGKAVGREGYIYVTKNMGLIEPYTGCCPLASGEIGDDVAAYLHQSEQTPAVVAVGVLVDVDGSCLAAGGFFIQALPGAPEDVLLRLEKNVRRISSVTRLIASGYQVEDLLQKVFGDIPLEPPAAEDCKFSCRCSRERLEKILLSMGKDELEDMIAKEKGAQLRCHFCNEVYFFTTEELQNLAGEIKQYEPQGGDNDE
mgnify:CR=1 FL=1